MFCLLLNLADRYIFFGWYIKDTYVAKLFFSSTGQLDTALKTICMDVVCVGVINYTCDHAELISSTIAESCFKLLLLFAPLRQNCSEGNVPWLHVF